MNHIEIKKIQTIHGYEENYWVIDGKTLPEYLSVWTAESEDDYLKAFGSFGGMCPAWNKDMDWAGDVRFVWKLIEMDKTILPLLLCEEDPDFSCVVIVVEVEKTDDFIFWNRIGYVLHENEDFEEEKKCGILYTDSYSEEDWKRYGDNIAFANVDSPLWQKWISENWDEELYRRRMNYTLPYYQTEENICWIKETDWVFDRAEYNEMVNLFWNIQTMEQLKRIETRESIDVIECANMLADLTSGGRKKLEEHIKDYSEILLHVLAGELVTEPLIELLKSYKERVSTIEVYSKAIEVMWEIGNDEVVNVVDVTILERLSDDEYVWQKFGTFISDEFKNYINEEVLKWNIMMAGAGYLGETYGNR